MAAETARLRVAEKFVPAGRRDIGDAYWRQRQQHIGDASRCTQHMQKALTQMNVQLANAISDISGTTGQAMLSAIIAGERDPWKLARLRDPRVKASEATARSLEGNWRPELLFGLRQELAHGNVPAGFDLREELYRTSGVDLTAIDGINVLTVRTLIAEVGSDMSRFDTEAHFVSILNLSPRNKVSGGKVVGREKRKTKNRAGPALRLAAGTLLKSDSYLGALYRRLRTKLGAPKARKAMANKLARIACRMLKYRQNYIDKGKEFYEQKYRRLQIRLLAKKATELGFQPTQTA